MQFVLWAGSLSRLAGGFGVLLSLFFARAELRSERLLPRRQSARLTLHTWKVLKLTSIPSIGHVSSDAEWAAAGAEKMRRTSASTMHTLTASARSVRRLSNPDGAPTLSGVLDGGENVEILSSFVAGSLGTMAGLSGMLNGGESSNVLSEFVSESLNATAGLEVYKVTVKTQRYCSTSWLGDEPFSHASSEIQILMLHPTGSEGRCGVRCSRKHHSGDDRH